MIETEIVEIRSILMSDTTYRSADKFRVMKLRKINLQKKITFRQHPKFLGVWIVSEWPNIAE